jgi:hypothetical protein
MDNVFKKFFSNGEAKISGFGNHFNFESDPINLSSINPSRRAAIIPIDQSEVI